MPSSQKEEKIYKETQSKQTHGVEMHWMRSVMFMS